MKASEVPTRPRHRLLNWARRWHAWGGVFAATFLVVVGGTGVLLNYKKPILGALGLEPGDSMQRVNLESPEDAKGQKSDFSTATGLGAAGVSAEEALTIARRSLGDALLDRIELKREPGALVWKIKATDEREVIVDAKTGAAYVKGRYEKVSPGKAGALSDRTTDWGKIALDLHTGKIGGEAGKALMTAVAMVLVFLSLSGVYLYAKPILIRRGNARARISAIARGKPPTDMRRGAVIAISRQEPGESICEPRT